MQVYVELALIENFCMDFTLLYAAKLASKNACKNLRLIIASSAGAVLAVIIPLFDWGAVFSIAVKIASGLFICLLAAKFKNIKIYLKFTLWFFVFTALLGGALIGVFSLAGIDYAAGEGFLLSSVPVGIPLFCALLLIIGARKLAKKLSKGEKNAVICRIYRGQNKIEIKGFFDSGNKVYAGGEPVSVIPLSAAEKLIDTEGIKDSVKIHTVAGSRAIKIFTADRIEIDSGGKIEKYEKVKLGISFNRLDGVVLHPDLSEN